MREALESGLGRRISARVLDAEEQRLLQIRKQGCEDCAFFSPEHALPLRPKAAQVRKHCIITLIVTIASALTTVSARAEDEPRCFDLASLQGNYTIIGTYGANVAMAFAKRYVDGNGNLTGTFIVNEPVVGSPTGERKIVSGTQAGTLTVNCDGTGVVTRILTVGGVQTEQFDDFVITGAIIEDGHLIATSVADATRTPSVIVPGGIFFSRVWTRIPSREKHED